MYNVIYFISKNKVVSACVYMMKFPDQVKPLSTVYLGLLTSTGHLLYISR